MNPNLQNYILLIAGLINLIMSIFIISRGWKNKVNLYFSLLTFFNFLWAGGLFISRSTADVGITSLFSRSTYVSAIAIIISLLYFVIYFPYKSKELHSWQKIIIWVPAMLLSVIIFTNYFIVEFITAYSEYEFISVFYKPIFLIYVLYFVSLASFSIYYLLDKYKGAVITFRKQTGLLLITIIIGLIFGAYFDLFLIYMGDFRFNGLGPLFTVFMNAVVFYLIFSSKKEK